MSSDTLSPTTTSNSLIELLSAVGNLDQGGLCSRNGQELAFDSLRASCDVLGLYFSAHWCPPCKAFTPQLVETYQKLKEEGGQFEIIFVSSDRSETSYQTYLLTMPWLSIPYPHSTIRSSLASHLNVKGIPSLVLLDCKAGLDVITCEGRYELNEDPEGEFFPWYPRLVNMLSPRQCPKLTEAPALILFIEGENEDEIEFAETVLLATAEFCHSAVIQDRPLLFFVSVHEDINTQLRTYLQVSASYPHVALVDFPRQRFSQLQNESVINKNVLINFVKAYFSKSIAFQSLHELSQHESHGAQSVTGVLEEIFL